MNNAELLEKLKLRSRALGAMALSLGLLVVDRLWQVMIQAWNWFSAIVPALIGLIVTGLIGGASIVTGGWVVARYGQILEMRVNWAYAAAAWAMVVLVWGIVALGWMLIRAVGAASMNLTSTIHETAGRIASVVSEGRRPRPAGKSRPAAPATPRAEEPAGGGSFVPWSEGIGLQNEMAEELRSRGISEENIEETIRQFGRGEEG